MIFRQDSAFSFGTRQHEAHKTTLFLISPNSETLPPSIKTTKVLSFLSAMSSMRKRERENPCGVCGHYHKCEEGEVCGVCGHRSPPGAGFPVPRDTIFPAEIIKDFLYLGSYDHANRSDLLKRLSISRILNTVPACQNLYINSFTYHCLPDGKSLQFDDAIQFIEQCAKDKTRVLVHCMTGKSRSAAIVIAYLMKCKGWRLAESFQWVKERRTQVDLHLGFQQQLAEFEQRISESNMTLEACSFSYSQPTFGFSKPADISPVPIFNQLSAMSIFDRTGPSVAPTNFVFGSAESDHAMDASS